VALGDLQKTLNDTLGADQGTKHAPPYLKSDIESLMNSLDEHKIYEVQKGRMLRTDEIVKDVIVVGLQNLTSGLKNPLSEYNSTVQRLQKRRNMTPVSLSVLAEPSAESSHPQLLAGPTDTIETPSIPTVEMDDEEAEGSPV